MSKSKIKHVIFMLLPFIVYSVYRFFVSNFIENYSLMSSVMLMTAGVFAIIVISQIFFKNKIYFPVGFFVTFLVLSIISLSLTPQEYTKVLGTTGFLAVLLKRPEILIYISLFIVAFFPPLIKIPPFTNYFAKQMVPEHFHSTRLYRVINLILNYFWALIFSFSIISQFSDSLIARIIIPAILHLGMGLPSVIFGVPYLQKKLAFIQRGESKDFINSAQEAIYAMPYVFNAKKAKNINIIVQYNISGDENFQAYMVIENGKCEVKEGEHASPNLIFNSPANTFLKVARGELAGQEAFLKGYYEIKGDLDLLIDFEEIFNQKQSPDKSGKKQSANDLRGFEKKFFKAAPGEIKNVVAIQASPRAPENSMTEIILESFLKGCENAGANTEIVYLNKKDIKYCKGCFSCWTKTPGKCIHNDDVRQIVEKELNADLVVYASPLYHFGMYSKLKAYIERTLFTLKPYLIEYGDYTVHPFREGMEREKNYLVVIGVCGFPEIKHFEQFSAHFHMLSESHIKNSNQVIGEIYRPASETLNVFAYKKETQRVINACISAGEQVIEKGYIDNKTQDDISTVSFDIQEFRKQANLVWDKCIKDNKLPMNIFED